MLKNYCQGGVFLLGLTLLVVLCPAPALRAQIVDTTATERPERERPRRLGVRKMTDTIPDAEVLGDTVVALSTIRRRPRNALLWSIIPGGGQVYNSRLWKVPLVYSGLLGAVAYADFNQTRYTRFTRALENRCLGDGNIVIPPNRECIPTTDEFPVERVSNDALLQARARADQARQAAYIGIFAVFILQAVEAYTDAHLQDFDISDDLSIRLGPVLHPDGSLAAGLSIPLGSGRGKLRQEAQVSALQRAAR